jgi:hypothetical protein
MTELIEALRLLWDKGITMVSPGTLGMHLTPARPPLDNVTMARIAEKIGARWDEQGEWIVMEKRP